MLYLRGQLLQSGWLWQATRRLGAVRGGLLQKGQEAVEGGPYDGVRQGLGMKPKASVC